MNVRFFNPGKGYVAHRDEMLGEIDRVLTAGDLIMRDDLEKFEQSLANYTGSKYAVGLNSGTDALYLTLWALGIGKGDEVLVPSHTFVASAQVVVQLGATPVLYDMDMRFEISEKTKAIMVAHIAGEFSCDMERLMELANEKKIPVIEDACQALGAVQHGKYAGSFGIAGCFSFYPAKILGAYGDAGAIVTDDIEMRDAVRELRNHCKSTYAEWGINSRLDNVQAAVLNVKMKHLPKNQLRRAEIAEMYREGLSHLENVLTLPKYTEGRVWQDYVIQLAWAEKRNDLYGYLKERGVETMLNDYAFPIPKCPQSLHYEETTLRIPCNDLLTNEEVQYVIDCIKDYFASPDEKAV